MNGPSQSQCRFCSHYTSTITHRCAAFPDRIPDMILVNHHDHRKPFDGDGGVRFEPKPGVAKNDLVTLYGVLSGSRD